MKPLFFIRITMFLCVLFWCAACADSDDPAVGGGVGSGTGDAVDPAADSRGLGRAGLGSCFAGARTRPGTGNIRLGRVFESVNFSFLVFALQQPNSDDSWYFVQQGGKVTRVVTSNGSPSPFVDLTDRVDASGSEMGLLGMAFHPKFSSNGFVYLSYTATTNEDGRHSRISRFISPDQGVSLDPASEVILLTVPQFAANHNGGFIGFGPDGFLYAAFGDGGGGGDPNGHGQDLDTLLGTVVRIDVDGGAPYAVPGDNPFVGVDGADEIFAYGLRNPWRMSFDRLTGDLWLADVGQGDREEINRIVKGGNYGWNVTEGDLCHDPPTDCDRTGLSGPVLDYPRADGKSVTGGYVYRGDDVPSLHGKYIFGDFVDKHIWSFQPGDDDKVLLMDVPHNISSFAEGNDGELYVLGYEPGQFFRFEAETGGTVEVLPESNLTDTGCVDAGGILGVGVVPYSLVAPFWSDGAQKNRGFSIPPDATITVDDAGDLHFPNGTVLVKNFRRATRLVETRIFQRHTDGVWAGYSYEWNDEQTEATLRIGGGIRDTHDGQWYYPSRSECFQCHTDAAGHSLGLELGQLVVPQDYGEGELEQVPSLVAAGYLEVPEMTGSALVDPFGGASLESRARSYLHTNCSSCHRPGAPGRGSMDLRFTTSSAGMGVCAVEPETGDLGVANAQLLAPGQPDRSMLLVRMDRRDENGMPQVGSLQVDQAGVNLVREWITSLESCESQ